MSDTSDSAQTAEIQRLRTLRAEGVQCAMFDSEGNLTSVSFFPAPPPPPKPPKKETLKEREAREEAEKAAEENLLYGSAGG